MNAEFDEELVDRILELTRRLFDGDADQARRLERRRARLLAAMDARLNVRDDDDGLVLVLYPSDWVDGDAVDPDRIDDRSRALERPLDRTGGTDSWEAVMEDNMAVAAAVETRHGPRHGANAEALGTYLANHHLRRIGAATESELQTFLREYYPRNVWPTPAEANVVRESVELAREVATESSHSRAE